MSRLGALAAEYVLPLRWVDDREADSLTEYLGALPQWLDVTIVDGSGEQLRQRHQQLWSSLARVVPPEPWPGANGKVRGVMTGLRIARHEKVVIADDDVRYEPGALARIVQLLDQADIVRPQNYFTALPWHARWDTARSLINRALAGDYPGTLAVRRTAVLAAGGYDGDVLFENLELIRTVRAIGGRELRAHDLLVGRVPPTASHFLSQRVRQAYDDFAQPVRLVTELSLLPLALWAARRPARLLIGIALGCALAERGRRRAGGTAVFPASSSLWAPLWLLERAVCVWLAVGARLTGGARYGDTRLRRAATPPRVLARQLSGTDARAEAAA